MIKASCRDEDITNEDGMAKMGCLVRNANLFVPVNWKVARSGTLLLENKRDYR